jgi:predicted 2-oxoglutarate/Fe(II)-dependent dioxygenase YbiX
MYQIPKGCGWFAPLLCSDSRAEDLSSVSAVAPCRMTNQTATRLEERLSQGSQVVSVKNNTRIQQMKKIHKVAKKKSAKKSR